jgi:UPF0755 protein
MLKRILLIFFTLLIICLAAFFLAGNYYNAMLQPVKPEATEDFRIIEIPPGASAGLIGEILYQENLIQNQQVFGFYVRVNNLGQRFIAGHYRLSPSFSLEQIAEIIQSGEVYSETVWFTIPEGFTVNEIALKLEEKGLIEVETFLGLCSNPSVQIIESFPEISQINNPDVDYLLEGYLFPDTYEVYPDVSDEEIVILMLGRLKKAITAEHRERIEQLNSSLHEILTIAAMVEREGKVDHERALIAGVIYNRLQFGMRLQIDATIQYALGEVKEFLTFKDLEIESPYNTYQNDGLPPGPIAAPGEASILATLYPEVSDFLYYNYKYDGSGEHYFSKTLQEHNENVARAEANLP